MPTEEQNVAKTSEESTATTTETLSTEAIVEQERSEKILKAKELYSHGSRNFLVKSFAEAADELSQVCALYEELYGELSDELGMPYLLYAKSLIALALDENKVIDVPDEEEDDDEDDEEENGAEAAAEATNGKAKEAAAGGTNGTKLESIKEDAVDTTEEVDKKNDVAEEKKEDKPEKMEEESEVSSTEDTKTDKKVEEEEEKKPTNGDVAANGSTEKAQTSIAIDDGEKPSTSNGEAGAEEDDEENEAASNLQLAWEILELAAKIFSRQGERGLPNLAEVQTELANIEFENNILDSARDDYEKALIIYKELPNNYRRAMAEIHYKIGLTFLMQQQNKEGAASLKEACNLIAGEIEEIKKSTELTEKDKNNIQDMEETKQEIEAKITEIEETQAQNIAEVRAALDSYIKPLSSGDVDAGSSKSATAASATAAAVASSLTADGTAATSAAIITSSSKPNDISHLIKRKKPEEPTSEAEAAVACSPAKRPAREKKKKKKYKMLSTQYAHKLTAFQLCKWPSTSPVKNFNLFLISLNNYFLYVKINSPFSTSYINPIFPINCQSLLHPNTNKCPKDLFIFFFNNFFKIMKKYLHIFFV
ncbi:Protein NASP like protein [Lucilia cuprina]|nr:Protein NASP like protein [Lucilia cuprina]